MDEQNEHMSEQTQNEDLLQEQTQDLAQELDEQAQQEPQAQDPLQVCQQELEAQKDKYLRVHADFENVKKRLEKEKYQALEYANESFAKDLLDVFDTLEMALNAPDQSFEQLVEGVGLIRANLLKVFEKHGVKEIETQNGFDPNFHEAVMQMPSGEHSDGEIVQVLKKGFAFKERVLRPTMVGVCKN